MRNRTIGVVVGLVMLVGGISFPAEASPCDGALCAGSARADITPPIGTPLWGYSARAFYSQPERWLEQRTSWIDTDLYAKALFVRSTGVHTRLYARAIVLRNRNGTKMALVQADLGAITGELHRAIAKKVAGLGIARDFLLLSATHTHGGPGTVQQPPAHGLLVGDHFDPRTFTRVVEGVTRAVRDADAALAPARVAIGQGAILDASVNRALRAHAGTHDGAPPANFDPCPDPEAYEADVPVPCDHRLARADDAARGEGATSPHAIDPTVTALRVDRTDGVPLGIWSSFAAHGTMVWGDDLIFSADNQGIAARLIEEGIGARARDAGIEVPPDVEIVAAYANGSEGDIAPAGSGHNRFAAMEDSGRRQARAVLALYDRLGAQLQEDIELDARWDWAYLTGEGGTSPVAILGAGPDCPVGAGAELVPGHGRKCPFLVLSGTGPNWFSLQVLRLGNVVAASVPGEVTVQMSRRIKKRLIQAAPSGIIPIVIGLANDYGAYFTTPEEYDVQDYEGTFTLWGRNEGPWLRDRFGDLADRMFQGRPDPAFIEPVDAADAQTENVSASRVVSAVAARAGTVLRQPVATVERGDVVSFSWIGDAPSVDMPPDETFVETRCEGSDGSRVRITDQGFDDIIDYWREGLEDRWGVQWDVPMNATPGVCRFIVGGRRYTGTGTEPYAVVSSDFEVRASDALLIASVRRDGNALLVDARYPAPAGSNGEVAGCSSARGAPACNFRWRASGPSTPSATASIRAPDGSTYAVEGTYDVDARVYRFDVPSGEFVSLRDGDGNTGIV